MKLFVDTNIMIDFLTRRSPFDVEAGRLFSLAEQKLIICGISSLSVVNTQYQLLKLMNLDSSKKVLRQFKLILSVHSLNDKIIELGLNDFEFKDFEYAVQFYSAVEFGYDVIITRNQKDFKTATIPVMAPSEYLASRKNNPAPNQEAG